METRRPSLGRIVTMLLFALSCLALLLFLWFSFGGTIPLKPAGYRILVSFPNADELGTQADVRIAGVNVGKVVSKSLDPQASRTIATLELDSKFAPIHEDARAILRQKTIAGETYVEITPGSADAKVVPDGAMLGRGNVQPAVRLDQIFDTSDPITRHSLQVWVRELATALTGNDQNLNSVLGNLPAFAANANDLVGVLDVEHAAVMGLLQNGSTTFAALGRDQGALRNLVTNAETTFRTTAANNRALADTFHVFPTFLNESKATMARLKSFALDTDPLIKQLIGVARDSVPALRSARILSPDLRRLFVNLGPLVTAAKRGLPATRDVLLRAKPLLGSLGPFLEQLNPILTWLSGHQQLVSDAISVAATATGARTTSAFIPNLSGTGHYLRQYSPADLSAFSQLDRRPAIRGNTYPPALGVASPLNLSAGGQFPGSTIGPSWDCTNTGGPRPANPKDPKGNTPACWVAPPLPGATPGEITQLVQAHYPSK